MKKELEEVIAQILDLGVDRREFVGCSGGDIAAFREALGVENLPAEYEAFLRLGGRGISYFQPVSCFYFPSVLDQNGRIRMGIVGDFWQKKLIEVGFGAYLQKLIIVGYNLDRELFLFLPELTEVKFAVLSHNGENAAYFREVEGFDDWLIGHLKEFCLEIAEMKGLGSTMFEQMVAFKSDYLDFMDELNSPVFDGLKNIDRARSGYGAVLLELYGLLGLNSQRNCTSIKFSLGLYSIIGEKGDVVTEGLWNRGRNLYSQFQTDIVGFLVP